MSPQMAAMFWVAVERGASLIVAAEPPSAGKTATLSALLAFTPPETTVYFTRGLGETFALPPRTDSHATYLLINEMSDHLPVYTWNGYARCAFELLAEGYSLATTMHADSVEGVLAQLEGELDIPRQQIANLTFIVFLYVGDHGATVRRVREVAFLQPDGDDLSVANAARWDSQRDDFQVLVDGSQRAAFARWTGLSEERLERELGRRQAFLERLLEDGKLSIPEVNAAIEGYYEEVLRPRRGG